MNLAEMFIAFVVDIFVPARRLILILCYIAGLGLLVLSFLRMLKHSNSLYHQAPSALGTMMTFLTGFVLMRLPSWLDAFALTIFGTGASRGTSILSYTTTADSRFDALNHVLNNAIFEILSLIGLIAFIRGIFVLRACSDGRPSATAGSAFMHMLGGVALWHISAIVDAVQTTLGIRILGI